MFRNLFLIGVLVSVTGVTTAKEDSLTPIEQTILALQKGTDPVLYSLDPDAKADKNDALHGWKILGSTPLKDAETSKKIREQLEKNLSDPKAVGAKCFDPRHAVQITHDKKKYDLVICFACHWIYVYSDGKQIGRFAMVREANQPLLDKVLTDAKVPLPKQARD